MRRIVSKAVLAVAGLSVGVAWAADPPPSVLVARTVKPAGSEAAPVLLDQWATSQRYVALVPTTAEILTFDYSDPSVVEVLTRSPAEHFYGVPFDAAVGAPSADKAFPDAKGMVAIVVGKNPGTCTVTVWGVKDGKAVKIDTILIQVGPRPPPVDPVKPPVDPVKPPVVSSFRVIFVTESATTLTAQQTAVSGAKSVRDYLNAKTTPEGGVSGWRNYDPNTTATNEFPGMKNVWTAAKPKVTTVPCMVVEVNGKAEIVPFPANAAEALTTLQSYGGK